MNRRVLRFLFVLWLCWYLSGPLFEAIDFWDTTQQEMGDIEWYSVVLTLLAVGLCVGMFLFRQFCACCSYLARSALGELSPLSFKPVIQSPAGEQRLILATSPLRI